MDASADLLSLQFYPLASAIAKFIWRLVKVGMPSDKVDNEQEARALVGEYALRLQPDKRTFDASSFVQIVAAQGNLRSPFPLYSFLVFRRLPCRYVAARFSHLPLPCLAYLCFPSAPLPPLLSLQLLDRPPDPPPLSYLSTRLLVLLNPLRSSSLSSSSSSPAATAAAASSASHMSSSLSSYSL